MSLTNRINTEHISFHPLHSLLIIVVCSFAFFINNQVVPADLMEARNLATAQEMVKDGSYLIPTLNGELRLEKPPLPTWIAAGVEFLFPGSLVAQRCVAGLVATMMIFFLYLLVIRLTRDRMIGLLAALVLATSFNAVMMGRTATWDIYCHSFMLGAIYFLVTALEGKGRQWGAFALSGIFLGLSFLGKGPVSFYALLLPFLIAYGLSYRPRMKGKAAPLVVMVLLFAVIAFWWMAYLYFFHRDMALQVAAKESSSWLNHNVRPWYYYWQFPAEAGIWALFWVTALVGYFACRKEKYRKDHTFSIVWLLSSLILLSVIPEKKTRYLLPILIPGAMTIAFYFYHCWRGFRSAGERRVFRINSGIIAFILMALPVTLYFIFYREGELSIWILTLTALFGWGLGLWIFRSILPTRNIKVMAVFSAIVLSMMMIESVCLIPIGKMFINPERHNIRMLREHKELEGIPFYYNKEEELRMEWVYESNRVIRPLDVKNDSLIRVSRPFVFLSKQPADSVFAGKGVTVKPIDTFDNNWRKTKDKRYNKELVREVVLIK